MLGKINEIRDCKNAGAHYTKYAWVTVIFNGHSYMPGTLVTAQSLRDVGTKYDIVCMVDDSISDEALDALCTVYDRIFKVKLIKTNTAVYLTKKQQGLYGSWIDVSCTKWAALYLTCYDKVILTDTDVVALKNADELFELNAPAAEFNNLWAQPFRRDGLFNPYVTKKQFKLGEGLKHGDKVPPDVWKTITQRFIEHNKHARSKRITFAPGGFLVLLKPSAKDADDYISWLTSHDSYPQKETFSSGVDEVSLFEFYTNVKNQAWYNIHENYSLIPWGKPNVDKSEVYMYHYMGKKPWTMKRGEWPDLADWYSVADRLTVMHPKLRTWFNGADSQVITGGGDIRGIHATNLCEYAILFAIFILVLAVVIYCCEKLLRDTGVDKGRPTLTRG